MGDTVTAPVRPRGGGGGLNAAGRCECVRGGGGGGLEDR